MEKVNCSKKQYRRLFTTACNDFYNNETELSIEDKISKLKVIEEKAKLMVACENEFRELLFASEENEEDIEKAIDVSESYIDKWRVLENKLNDLIHEKREHSEASSTASGSINSAHNKLLRYPKINLPIFDGNIKNWLCFWGQFQKIDKDSSLDNHDKYAYLAQAMEKGSSADELIKSFPPGGENYEKAIKQLQLRYGREELLIEVYVRDLLSIVLLKQKSQKTSLRKLYDQLETKLRSLETLGVTKDKYAAMLYPLVESALPDETLKAWERFRTAHRRAKEESSGEAPLLSKIKPTNDLDRLLAFLQDEVEGEERILIATQSFEQCKKTNYFHNKREINEKKFQPRISSATELLTSNINKKKNCIFCSEEHNSWNCRKAPKLTLQEKQSAVEKAHCCFLCLREGHGVKTCHSKFNCQLCGKKHHLFLCRTLSQGHDSSTVRKNNELEKPAIQHDEALANLSKSSNVFLQTLTVLVKGKNVKRRARAIIDSGSQRSYILKSTAEEMKYNSKRREYLQHSLFGGASMSTCQHDVFTIYLSSLAEDYCCHFDGLGQTVICDTILANKRGSHFKELGNHGIHLAEDLDGPIEVLIGADIAGKLITGNHLQLNSGLTAIETKLGWTVIGRTNTESSGLLIASMLTTNVCISELWTLDSLGITDPSEKKTAIELQEAAKQHFLETVKSQNDRFLVSLPWIEGHLPLPDNFELSEKRLHKVVKNLKAEGLFESYGKVLEEWLEENIIEEVPKGEIQLPAHYLPHRPVLKENSTTKIRPVFDASARQKGSPSLNDCLESGVNLIELIPNILYRFRLDKIGVISDIRKAFLQICLSPSDKDYLRFLWIGEDGQLKHFRHCRVVFGVSCSPFLLGMVILHHLQNVLDRNDVEYPENMLKMLMKSFYVDNCVTSVESERELKLFIKVATKVMAERQFDLRGWEYTNFTDEITPDTNVLGMQWDKDADTLRINMTSLRELCVEKVTKKIILSAAHRIFDPIGATCPVALFPKLLLQRTWEMKLNWEDEVDSGTKAEFLNWMRNIFLLEKVLIPRYLKIGDENEKYSLHFFCDASMYAYAAVAFFRVESSECVKVQLLSAKSRVSPTGKKKTTVARLELLAATIASRLASTIMLEIPHGEIHFWTDSSTVLTWIRREEVWGTFVQNRVSEIRALTSRERWRHVSGLLNPADLPSRGCSAKKLIQSRWWEGPDWLYLPAEKWPSAEFVVNEDEVLKERKKTVVSSSTTCLTNQSENVNANWYYRYFSHYEKIVRMIGWILRFSENSRKSKELRKQGSLNAEEFSEAEKRLIKIIQSETFLDENDEKLRALKVYKDENDIIRLKTKIVYREDSHSFTRPVILPSHHQVVKLLIFSFHKKHGHVGTQILLNLLREHFWILNGRKTVRSIVSKCVTCKRHSGKSLDADTAPITKDRIRDAAVFEVVGVDLAGPLYLKDQKKAWICLFTCAVYRAVHLELVSDISTETFLLALRRFVARRGRCTVIYCDNGTNFVGADNLLKTLDWNKIVENGIVNRIQWKFNPPTASWWGGWWERLIRVVKDVLKRVIGRACLSYEEMITVLCDCEAIINSRPLTYISESDSDFVPLTPSLFLQDIKEIGVPDCDAVDHKSLNKRVKYRIELQSHLRKRFRSEYLGSLIQRPKFQKYSTISVGDVVLIGSDNQKRINWPLGRVTEIIPGKEGITRLVKLRTARGEILRPIQRLFPLEITCEMAKDVQDHMQRKQISRSDASQAQTVDAPEPILQTVKTRSGRNIKRPDRLDL